MLNTGAIPLAGLPGSTPDIHASIEIDRATYFREPGDILLYREYALGRHKRVLTDQQETILENILDNRFCDNVCHQIIAEAADRLELLRWDCGDDDAVAGFLSTLYTQAKVKDFAGETHYNALRDGNYAIALAWDNEAQRVMLTREPWWDGNTGIFVGYDVQGEPLYAVKEWDTLEGRRRVVWMEDRLERYILAGQGGSWLPYQLPSDKGEWPMAWTKPDGTALHIPIIHFPNATRGTSVYGTSELDGGVLGFQDQINDLQYDMTAAGRMTGFQMLHLSGVTTPRLANGTPDPNFTVQVGPGQVFKSENADAKATVLPAGDITQLISLYNAKLKAVSRMTRTPLHSITGGDWPSGEALLRAEMPAVNKAGRQIAKFTDLWTMAAHRATEIANVFGRAGLDEDALIKAVFSPPDQRDPLSKSFVIKNIDDKISIREALRMMGYTPEQAENIYQEMQEEKDDMGSAVLSQFDKGLAGASLGGAASAERGNSAPGDTSGGENASTAGVSSAGSVSKAA